MSLRYVVYALLTSSVGVTAEVGTRIYDANALGTPTGKDIPAKPFLVTNYGGITTGPAEDLRVVDRTVDVYVYGEPGDYTRVEKTLRAVRGTLHRASGVFTDPDDSDLKTWLNDCKFLSSSGDLFDDVYRATCRYETYRLIGNTP